MVNGAGVNHACTQKAAAAADTSVLMFALLHGVIYGCFPQTAVCQFTNAVFS